ncbi:hypothetical protein AURDEDRAFT_165078 [Auricularia subglabra TFB-10046 SS5]|nr:hypothetical protein AURDEDRAFT_165078 [Auricularia subglabra TFB-10046 SS5]
MPDTPGLASIGSAAQLIRIPITEFRYTFPELQAHDRLPDLDADARAFAEHAMPNPLRKVADGDELFTVFVNLWADDVSGNVSKQYNKHINVYVSNMGLPAALLQQEYFVRFVSTSPSASAPEQFSAIKEHILATHTNPRQCYNAASRRTCKFRIVAQALPGDNPQQSENYNDESPSWFVNNFQVC